MSDKNAKDRLFYVWDNELRNLVGELDTNIPLMNII